MDKEELGEGGWEDDALVLNWYKTNKQQNVFPPKYILSNSDHEICYMHRRFFSFPHVPNWPHPSSNWRRCFDLSIISEFLTNHLCAALFVYNSFAISNLSNPSPAATGVDLNPLISCPLRAIFSPSSYVSPLSLHPCSMDLLSPFSSVFISSRWPCS